MPARNIVIGDQFSIILSFIGIPIHINKYNLQCSKRISAGIPFSK